MMSRDRDIKGSSQTHLLVVALDYKGTANELSCTIDGDNMQLSNFPQTELALWGFHGLNELVNLPQPPVPCFPSKIWFPLRLKGRVDLVESSNIMTNE